jgi:glycosyltransferase involved in cell wall biosynthesis
MTILQLISSSVGYYGAERVVITLSTELATQGVDVVVGAFDNTAKDSRLEVLEVAERHGLETVALRCRGRLDRKAVLGLRQFVTERKIDVIHSHGPKANLYAYLAAPNYGPALVSTCHSWYFNSAIERIMSFTDGIVLTRFDAVVAVSDPIQRKLRRRGVRRDRVEMIPNGINCAAFARRSGDARDQRRPRRGLVFGTAARLSPEKGFNHLVDAAAAVLAAHPEARFHVAGDGPESEALLAQVHQLEIASRFIFLGAVSDMAGFYADIDVFVLPSLTEGMPMALMEAMSAGKPVVATSVGSVPVLVSHGHSGLLVPPGDAAALADALRAIIADRDLRVRLGLRAQMTAEGSFSAASMANQYRAVYESIAPVPADAVGAHSL